MPSYKDWQRESRETIMQMPKTLTQIPNSSGSRALPKILLILFLILTFNASLWAQETEQKPNPVAPPAQTVEQSIEALFGPDEKEQETPTKKEPTAESNEPILYISDTDNGRIVVMQGIEGDGYLSIGLPGYGFGRFLRPAQIWVDHHGRLYVADSGNDRIVRIDQQAEQGWSEYGGLSTPTGVAVNSAGVYVADSKADRIVLLDTIGETAKIIEEIKHPQLTRPSSLWVDADGALYACCGEDPPGGKLFKTWMEKDRRKWEIFEGDGLTGARFRPGGLVTLGRSLKILDASGQRLISLNDLPARKTKEQSFRETRRWRLSRPQGIAIDKSGQRFFIADSGNDRILELKADGSVVGEFFELDSDPSSALRNPTSVFVFNPTPIEEPKEEDAKGKGKGKKKKSKSDE